MEGVDSFHHLLLLFPASGLLLLASPLLSPFFIPPPLVPPACCLGGLDCLSLLHSFLQLLHFGLMLLSNSLEFLIQYAVPFHVLSSFSYYGPMELGGDFLVSELPRVSGFQPLCYPSCEFFLDSWCLLFQGFHCLINACVFSSYHGDPR